MSSAPVLAVVKILTTSRQSGTQAMEWRFLEESPELFRAREKRMVRSGRCCHGRGLRIQQVKFLARLEANSLAWSDSDFRARPRIAANAGLARAHIEDPETSELNPVARSESLFQAFKNRVDSRFRLVAR